ncbi:MAG: TIGR01244 family sulfur transferase [Yoonia sp.]|uniref:TIGR01244 family sulfur transferase n=1 Tax=Yoonia sp. TaxID=2212373 RepID=UPI003EF6E64D
MELRKITDGFTVSPQITAQDMDAINAAGFGTIICNRPDGEAADQPAFAEIEAAAKAAGIATLYVPIQGGAFDPTDIAKFGAALTDMPQPVLAYCRTGTRSATLWSLSEAPNRPMT